MKVETKFPYDQDYVAAYSAKHNEPDWLNNRRKQALELSQSLPLPRLDKTKIDSWNMLGFQLSTEEQRLNKDRLPANVRHIFDGDENKAANVIVHKNGHVVYRQVEEELSNKGVIFTDIHTAFREHSELIQPYFMKLLKADEHKLMAIHAALVNCGIFVYVPKNQEVEIPLQNLFWQDHDEAGIVPHIVIVAEENSKVTYLEDSFDERTTLGVNHYAAEVYVGAGASVHFAAVDHYGVQTTNYIYRQAHVEQDGYMDWALGQMHAGHTVTNNTTTLKGNGSRCHTKSVSIGIGEQSQNFVQKVEQHGLHTDGQILSHAVMKDNARAIFNGITKIVKGATKSNGEQIERVLMLGERTRGDANPILLIDEDDVTAGHAASVGQVDKSQLYYLMSRGIRKPDAERLVILGFLYPVVEKIPLEGIKSRLVEVIERKVK